MQVLTRFCRAPLRRRMWRCPPAGRPAMNSLVPEEEVVAVVSKPLRNYELGRRAPPWIVFGNVGSHLAGTQHVCAYIVTSSSTMHGPAGITTKFKYHMVVID